MISSPPKVYKFSIEKTDKCRFKTPLNIEITHGAHDRFVETEQISEYRSCEVKIDEMSYTMFCGLKKTSEVRNQVMNFDQIKEKIIQTIDKSFGPKKYFSVVNWMIYGNFKSNMIDNIRSSISIPL